MLTRRVVVTGMGAITPIGNTVDEFWSNTLLGKSGVRFIKGFDVSDQRVKFSASIQDFNAEDYLNAKVANRYDEFIVIGYAAAVQAIRAAGLENPDNPTRVGVAIGSGIGGIRTINDQQNILVARGPRRVSPFFVPSSIVNMISGLVSIEHGFQGPNIAIVTACTTATHNIGVSARMIQAGDADVMIAGGAEWSTCRLTVAGFASMKALSTRNDEPERASRPWDKNRDGFVLGDGAGALVLESYEHAAQRGANILAEVAGFGMSADAHHITGPPTDGRGAMLSMQNALQSAELNADEVHYINAHGTSTPQGDIAETQAIKRVFGNKTKVAISSTKSMVGHLLGAAGSVEAIVSILSIRDQCAPPTINLDEPDAECDLDYVPHTARSIPIDTVLSNSFGFGGTNGTLIFKRV